MGKTYNVVEEIGVNEMGVDLVVIFFFESIHLKRPSAFRSHVMFGLICGKDECFRPGM